MISKPLKQVIDQIRTKVNGGGSVDSPKIQSLLNQIRNKVDQRKIQEQTQTSQQETIALLQKQIVGLNVIEQSLEKLSYIEDSIKQIKIPEPEKFPTTIKVTNLTDIPRPFFPDKLKVANPQDLKTEFPTSIKVSNLSEIPKAVFPEKIRVTNSYDFDWGSKLLAEISGKLDGLNFKWPQKASEAIPVRLSDGEKFYQMLSKAVKEGNEGVIRVIGGGSGGPGTPAYSDINGNVKQGLVDSDRHLQVDVLTMPTVAVTGTFWQATQPVSIAATVTVDTELPDAGVIGDGMSLTPTTSVITNIPLLFNGIGTGDRMRTITGTMNQNSQGIAASGTVVQLDDTTPTTLSEGNFGVWRGSSRREGYVQIRDAAGNERGVNVTASNELNVLDSNSAAIKTAVEIMDDWDNAASDGASVSGDVAHDSTDAGEPVKIGFKAYSPDGTTPGTAVAENDRTNAKGDLDGRLFTNVRHPRWWSYHEDSSNALTDASVQADPGDGFEIVITEIIFSTGAATACNIFFEEGSTKVLGPWYLEAVAGRGLIWRGEKHITASTAVTVTTSAAVAHGLDIQGYVQAV